MKKFLKFKYRIIMLIILILTIFLFFIFRLIQFQIIRGNEFLELSQKRTSTNIKLDPKRGDIVDRYGRIFATSKNIFNVVLDRGFLPAEKENEIILNLINILTNLNETWVDELPITMSEPYEFIEGREQDVSKLKNKLNMNFYATAQNCIDTLTETYKLRGYFYKDIRLLAGVHYSMLYKDFSINNRYIFSENISKETAIVIREKNYMLQGVSIDETTSREYVSGKTSSHLIGNIGLIYQEEYDDLKSDGYDLDDKIGKNGIEKSMEKYLKGKYGLMSIEQNKNGEVIDQLIKKEVTPGDTVVITIDKVFQEKVENILENHIKKLNFSKGKGKDAFAGAISVIDVRTGEVLALANYPSYDINEYNKNYNNLINDKSMPLFNRTLSGVYRPGSTYKTIVSIAGLAEGIIDENTRITCKRLYNYFGSSSSAYRPTCTGYHGNINVVTALKYSCNIFYYEVGRRLGIDKINEYAKMFGLGDDLSFDIQTKTGQLANPLTKKNWVLGDVVQAAIGQSETYVTPLQMSVQAMTLANDGLRYKPHVIKSINRYDYSESIETKIESKKKVNIDKYIFDIVEKGMIEAASRVGGKYSLSNLPFKVAIKTGTPQISENQYNSTVIGYAPVENPEIAISVVIEKGEYSNQIIRQIIDAYYEEHNSKIDSNKEYNELIP